MNVAENLNINRGGFSFAPSRSTAGQMESIASPLRIVADGDANFYHYLKQIGLNDDPDLIILSAKNHYYYGESDLKNVRTIINLKKLNLIKHLDKFLISLIRILPPETNFLGCFADTKAAGKNGSGVKRFERLVKRFNNFLDSRTDRNLNENEVKELLIAHGFRIFDMSKIDGVTYFHSNLVQST
jgi:hypothetical protein